MRRCHPLLFIVALLLGAGTATAAPPTPATHYRWTDSSGVVHFSDTIPASALAGGYDIVNADGLVVRHVGRQLTPSERKSEAAAAAVAAAAKRRAEQQSREDAQLLASYPTAKSLQDEQDAALLRARTNLTTMQADLHSQETSLAQLLAHAADLQQGNHRVPPYVHKRIAKQQQAINTARGALERERAAYTGMQAKLAAQLKHYHALRAKYDGSPAD